MAAFRKLISTSSFILVAAGISAVAAGILFTFPTDPLIWQAATWTLLAALIGLFVLVLFTGYLLATDRAARTWQRIASFLLGLACLVPVAVGLL
ncbi:hypothetical protein [Luteimonas sp. A534]